MNVLGCDPGLSGAFALYGDSGLLRVVDMPTYEAKAGKLNRERPFLDRPAIVRLLWNMHLLDDATTLIVELVGGIPGQAAHGAFTFGHGAGGITYAAHAIGYQIEEVPPGRWKGALKVSSDKRKAIDRATELMPAHVNLWAPVRGNGSLEQRSGRAEAALIAHYGQQIFGSLT